MAVCEEARHLLAAARRDLRALEGMSDAEIFADEIFGFHAQQAVEKSLKAWLSMLDVQYPNTHDLSLLLNMLESQHQKVSMYLDVIELNPFSVQFRYEAFEELGASIGARCSSSSLN